MYSIDYIHENNSNYMVVNCNQDESVENYQIKMLQENEIKEFLPVEIRRIDNKNVFYYDITSKQQLSRLFEYNNMSEQIVHNICVGIAKMARRVNEYMLDLDSVLIAPEHIYMNMSNKCVAFAYCTAKKENFSNGLKELFDFILEHFDHKSDRSMMIKVYDIYQKILHDECRVERLDQLFLEDDNQFEQNDSGYRQNDPNQEDTLHEQSYRYQQNIQMNENNQQQNNGSNSQMEIGKKGRLISHVLKEEVVNEKEKTSKTFLLGYKIITGILLVVILNGILNIFLPQFAVVQCGLIPAIVMMAVALLLIRIAKEQYEKRKVKFIKTEEEVKQIPYYIAKDQQESSSDFNSVSYYESANENNTGNSSLEFKQEAKGQASNQNTLIEDTILLSDYMEKTNGSLKLQPIEETINEPLVVNTFPYVVGSMKTMCEGSVNNPLVSRMHACIKKEGNDYIVEDLNSTNGTFINDQRINANASQSLKHGDVIRFAMVSYLVEIS